MALNDVIAERRDVRRFRPDEVADDVLERVLAAAHRAPSVGLMQPWRLIVVRDQTTRSEIRRLAQRERIRQADRFEERARLFLGHNIEGVVERRSAAALISTTRFIAVAAGTWARAGIALLRLTQQRLRLKRQLRRQLAPLGPRRLPRQPRPG